VPFAIENNSGNTISVSVVVLAIISAASEHEALLVSFYSNHALMKVLGEKLSQPVVGIMQAFQYVARCSIAT
jgi:Asp/Glu/hydantoin racemase